jgi:hypothetical protein
VPDPNRSAPAEQATRRPRRTPAFVDLEQRLADAYATVRDLEATIADGRRQRDQDVATMLRLTARAETAERLLALAVAALNRLRHEDGDLPAEAADALAAIVHDVLGLDPDQRPPQARYGGPPPADAFTRELGRHYHVPEHAEHPDDDETPIEP